MHLHIGSVYRTYGQVQEMAVRETALRSLLEDQKGELLHQSQSLQQVNADLAQNWTSVRSKQQELNALEDALAAGMLYTHAHDFHSPFHVQGQVDARALTYMDVSTDTCTCLSQTRTRVTTHMCMSTRNTRTCKH